MFNCGRNININIQPSWVHSLLTLVTATFTSQVMKALNMISSPSNLTFTKDAKCCLLTLMNQNWDYDKTHTYALHPTTNMGFKMPHVGVWALHALCSMKCIFQYKPYISFAYLLVGSVALLAEHECIRNITVIISTFILFSTLNHGWFVSCLGCLSVIMFSLMASNLVSLDHTTFFQLSRDPPPCLLGQDSVTRFDQYLNRKARNSFRVIKGVLTACCRQIYSWATFLMMDLTVLQGIFSDLEIV